MLAIKAIPRISQLPLSFVIVAAVVCTGSSTFIEERPVYWIDRDQIVFNEYVDINIDVEIISPCDLNAFPPGFNKSQLEIDKMRLDCIKRYHENFLLPLTGHFHCGHKERETIPIETGNKNVSVKLALLAGYGSIYAYSSINPHKDISEMNLKEMANKTEVRREDLVKMVESELSIKRKFEYLLGLPNLNMRPGITESTALLSLAFNNMYSWDKESVDTNFLKVIGIEDYLQAFGDVYLKPVRNFDCSFDLNWTNLKLTFSPPKINRNMRIFHAGSFDLMETFDDYICVLKYNGTRNVVWSTKKNCIVATDVKPAESEPAFLSHFNKAFYIQSNSCIPMLNEDRPYFAVSACYKRGMWRPQQFFNVKSVNQSWVIYCDGGFVNYPTENDPPIPCPHFVFRVNSTILPITANGKEVVNYALSGNFIRIPSASTSQTVNRTLLSAPLNTTAIMMSEMEIFTETKMNETEIFVLPPVDIAILIIMGCVILIMILVALVYVYRKFGLAVCTKVNSSAATVTFWKNRFQPI